MKKADIEFYKHSERQLEVMTIINSIIVFGFLFMGMALGQIEILAFLVNPLLLIYGSFAIGFILSVLSWRGMIQKYERENHL